MLRVQRKLGKVRRRDSRGSRRNFSKSRKENDLSDERTKYIGLKGANFAITILIPL